MRGISMGKRPKKPKKTPRQKVQKGLDVFKEWISNQKPKDLADVGLILGLAAVGYQKLGWKGALWGPISLKLATSPGGTPPFAQMSGVAGLGIMGLAMSGDMEEGLKESFERLKGIFEVGENCVLTAPWDMCPMGYARPNPGSLRCCKVEQT